MKRIILIAIATLAISPAFAQGTPAQGDKSKTQTHYTASSKHEKSDKGSSTKPATDTKKAESSATKTSGQHKEGGTTKTEKH